MHAMPGQLPGQCLVIQLRREPGNQVHAGFDRGNLQKAAQAPLQHLQQALLAGLVQRPHATDMANEVAFTHEIGGHCLQQGRRAAVEHRAQGAERFDQCRGQNHVTQA
ncbi:hypothetical protein D3C84_1117100 [compost metagenome]